MSTRRQEKAGWTLGWLGAFLWVPIVSVVFLFQAKWLRGAGGAGVFAIAAASIVGAAPWRHPSTPYWKLMLFPYACFTLSVIWAVWAFGGFTALDLNWWNFLWMLPMFLPLGILSRRKWTDAEVVPDGSGDARGMGR
ncbi:MAG: hypothetical protein GX443_16380 [Deltaproteobacteria bacterium]|nr:hypothetical protein [Deltaproteobacteria bacterium]